MADDVLPGGVPDNEWTQGAAGETEVAYTKCMSGDNDIGTAFFSKWAEVNAEWKRLREAL